MSLTSFPDSASDTGEVRALWFVAPGHAMLRQETYPGAFGRQNVHRPFLILGCKWRLGASCLPGERRLTWVRPCACQKWAETSTFPSNTVTRWSAPWRRAPYTC